MLNFAQFDFCISVHFNPILTRLHSESWKMLFDKVVTLLVTFQWHLNHLNRRLYKEVMVEIINTSTSFSWIIIHARLYFSLLIHLLGFEYIKSTWNLISWTPMWASISSRLFLFEWMRLGPQPSIYAFDL